MEITKQQILNLIEILPGPYAIYVLIDDTVRTVYSTPDLPGFSGMTEEEYNETVSENALNMLFKTDREIIINIIKEKSKNLDRSDVKLYYRIKHKVKGFIWANARGRFIGNISGYSAVLVSFSPTSNEAKGYAQMMENSNDPVFVIDKNSYELLYTNNKGMLNNYADNFTGRKCYECIFNRSESCKECRIAESQKEFSKIKEGYIERGGKFFEVETKSIEWYNRDAYVVYLKDVTEHKEKQAILETSKKKTEYTLNNLPIGIAVNEISETGEVFQTINESAYEILGFENEDIAKISEEMQKLIVDEDLPMVKSKIQKLKCEKEDINMTFRYEKPGSENMVWLNVKARFIAENGKKLTLMSIADVTQRKELENQSKETKQKYQNAVETSNMLVWDFNIQRRRIKMIESDLYKKLNKQTGLDRIVENVPYVFFEYMNTENRNKILEMHKKLEAGEKEVSAEICYNTGNPSKIQCKRITYTVVSVKNGKPITAFGIGQDITEEKLALSKNERIYKQLTTANPNSVALFRLNLTENWCGDAEIRNSKYKMLKDNETVDELFASISEKISNADIRKNYEDIFRRSCIINAFNLGHSNMSIEYPITYINSCPQWHRLNINIIQNPHTGDIEAVAYLFDITKQKLNAEIIDNITETNYDYIGVIYTKTHEFEFFNYTKKFQANIMNRKVNYEKSMEYVSNSFIPEEEKEYFLDHVKLSNIYNALSLESEYDFTYVRSISDDEIRYKQMKFSWMKSTSNAIILLQTDVTSAYYKNKHDLELLEKALENAEKANLAKSEFVSRLSHYIRTPINVISNMTDFAEEDINNAEKLKDDLEKIKTANKFLNSLISDILDISKIDSGKLELLPEVFSFKEFIENIRNMFDSVFKFKGINFFMNEKETERYIFADRVRMNQIILNILSNALKYTPENGTVKVDVYSKLTDSTHCECGFIVKDNGIGMSEKFQKQMFAPFEQENSNPGRDSTQSGTGLGLAIVKRLLNLMDGTIKVESEIGKGTEIEVSAVFKIAEAPETEKVESVPAAKKLSGKILLAEDQKINVEIAKRLLYKFNFKVVHAENGEEAVRIFKDSDIGEFTAVLMDIQIPILNGFEATEQIRALKREDAQEVPIIAMTANVFEEAVNRAKIVGMDGYVIKPIDSELLKNTLMELL